MRSHSTGLLCETRSLHPHFWRSHTLTRRQCLLRYSIGVLGRPRQGTLIAKAAGQKSYEELSRSYSGNLLRGEAQLAVTRPALIQITEVMEGFFLLTALSLQLIPVCYAAFSMNKLSGEKQEESVSMVADEVKQEQYTSVETSPVQINRLETTQFSLWSAVCLVVGVVLGSILRRFDRSRMLVSQSLMPASPPGLNAIDREEIESNVSRAFGEISHLASQVEKLRVKTRVISNEYGNALKSNQTESNQFKQALHEVINQLKATEQRVADLNEVMLKMQGLAVRQFEVVSSALRRIDNDCKSLTAQLSIQPEAAKIEETAELDFKA